MLHTISDNFNSYVDQIPANTTKAVIISSALSFTVTVIFTGVVPLAGAAAACAAGATVIDALVNPIFEEGFSENGQYGFFALLAKRVVVITATIGLAGPVSLELINQIPLLIYLFMDIVALSYNEGRVSSRHTEVYIF